MIKGSANQNKSTATKPSATKSSTNNSFSQAYKAKQQSSTNIKPFNMQGKTQTTTKTTKKTQQGPKEMKQNPATNFNHFGSIGVVSTQNQSKDFMMSPKSFANERNRAAQQQPWNSMMNTSQYQTSSKMSDHSGTRKVQWPSFLTKQNKNPQNNRFGLHDSRSRYWNKLTNEGTINSWNQKFVPGENRNNSNTTPKTGVTFYKEVQRPNNDRGKGGLVYKRGQQSGHVNVTNQKQVVNKKHASQYQYVEVDLCSDKSRQSSVNSASSRFSTSSNNIGFGCTSKSQDGKSYDPASNLKQDKNFKKTYEANNVWQTNSEPVDPLMRTMPANNCKSQSRERYFTSQIDVLPGPNTGVHQVKTRDNRNKINNEIVSNQRARSDQRERTFASQLSQLPGGKTTNQDKQMMLHNEEQNRLERRKSDTCFQLKNQIFYGSVYQKQQQNGINNDFQVPKEFSSYDMSTDKHMKSGKNKNDPISQNARQKLVYNSQFKLE